MGVRGGWVNVKVINVRQASELRLTDLFLLSRKKKAALLAQANTRVRRESVRLAVASAQRLHDGAFYSIHARDVAL